MGCVNGKLPLAETEKRAAAETVPLPSADALAADSHLRLGITTEGINYMLDRLDFYSWGDGDSATAWNPFAGKYNEAYERRADVQWIDEKLGPLREKDGDKLTHRYLVPEEGELVPGVTGYDLGSQIRHWLRKEGKDHLSVCEVLAAENSAFVGHANVFYSHMQSPGIGITLFCMNDVFLMHGSKLPDPNERFIWLDYFSLRQCQSDFNIDRTYALIHSIGLTIVEMDFDLQYLGRSFCLFEAWVTVKTGSKFLVYTPGEPWDKILRAWQGASVVEKARCWSPTDKQTIDSFIRRTVGFEELAKTVHCTLTEAFHEQHMACSHCGSKTTSAHGTEGMLPEGVRYCHSCKQQFAVVQPQD